MRPQSSDATKMEVISAESMGGVQTDKQTDGDRFFITVCLLVKYCCRS
jgi:hypothetical protein